MSSEIFKLNNQEINIQIAEKIMGWTLFHTETNQPAKSPEDYKNAMRNDGWQWKGREGPFHEAWEWSPSTDFNDSSEVMNSLIDDCGIVISNTEAKSMWTVEIEPDEETGWKNSICDHASLPKAICIAFFLAVEK